MSEGWIVERSVVVVKSGLEDGVAGASVGLLRFVDRFSQDVQGFNAGTVNQICLSTLAIQGAEALSLFPGGTITWQGLMLILVCVLLFGQWGRGGRCGWGRRRGREIISGHSSSP